MPARGRRPLGDSYEAEVLTTDEMKATTPTGGRKPKREMITWRKWQPTFSFFSNSHQHSTQKKPQKPSNEVQIENYEEWTYKEYNWWLWKNKPMGQTCQRTPSIMKTMIQKLRSLPLLKKNNRLLTWQIEEEEFWKQFDRREQIIWLMKEIDNAIAETVRRSISHLSPTFD